MLSLIRKARLTRGRLRRRRRNIELSIRQENVSPEMLVSAAYWMGGSVGGGAAVGRPQRSAAARLAGVGGPVSRGSESGCSESDGSDSDSEALDATLDAMLDAQMASEANLYDDDFDDTCSDLGDTDSDSEEGEEESGEESEEESWEEPFDFDTAHAAGVAQGGVAQGVAQGRRVQVVAEGRRVVGGVATGRPVFFDKEDRVTRCGECGWELEGCQC